MYDHAGLLGLKHNGNQYYYRKNVQGDVIAILDSAGNIVVNYVYDAWGNHTANPTEETYSVIAQANPFRYRGYYYDTETGLYFLKTRYYDPDISRFITIDDLDYLDPETINGLNLYAYCVNNPVMHVDPNGTEVITALAILAAVLFSTFMGTMSGIAGAALNDRHIGIGAAIGAVGGLLNGGLSLVAGAFGALHVVPFISPIIAAVSEYLNQLFNHEEIDGSGIAYAALGALFTSGISYLVGSNLDTLSKDALSYILSPVMFGIQMIADSLVSVFGNPISWIKEKVTNLFTTFTDWFKRLFHGNNPSSGGSSGGGGGRGGSSGGGGGGGGAGGRSW